MNILQKPIRFLNEVRYEVRRVTWPTRREVVLTAVFVFLFTAIAAFFFAVIDSVLFRALNFIIGR
jgi:preprotein translocase subunit SecE